MTTYIETPSGGVVVGGCPIEEVTYAFPSVFEVGDIAYHKKKATNGKVERIGIQEVIVANPNEAVVNGARNSARLRINYKDTYNGLWMESELVERSVALALIEAYEDRVAALKESRDLCD